VIKSQVARFINDILSDNVARTPMFGEFSSLFFQNYQVAAKTGTTQDFRDAWTIGYTPSVVVGVWVGNNDNSSMSEKPGVVLAGPIWRNFMEKVLIKYPKENFKLPEITEIKKPILKGEVDLENPHSILNYVEKDNPQGDVPEDPTLNSQYLSWEEGIEKWLEEQKEPN